MEAPRPPPLPRGPRAGYFVRGPSSQNVFTTVTGVYLNTPGGSAGELGGDAQDPAFEGSTARFTAGVYNMGGGGWSSVPPASVVMSVDDLGGYRLLGDPGARPPPACSPCAVTVRVTAAVGRSSPRRCSRRASVLRLQHHWSRSRSRCCGRRAPPRRPPPPPAARRPCRRAAAGASRPASARWRTWRCCSFCAVADGGRRARGAACACARAAAATGWARSSASSTSSVDRPPLAT